MSDKILLDLLGQKIMKNVRDQVIFEFESTLSGKMKSANAISLHRSLSDFEEKQIDTLKEFVLTSIDDAIYQFLNLLEQDENSLKLLISDGNMEKNVVTISDGLSGELFSDDGWIAKFSKYK